VLSLKDWLQERLDNCNRIAATRDGATRDGWFEDAEYFRRLIAVVDAADLVQGYYPQRMMMLPHVKTLRAALGKTQAKVEPPPWPTSGPDARET
jgi:hypothetical protein